VWNGEASLEYAVRVTQRHTRAIEVIGSGKPFETEREPKQREHFPGAALKFEL
jgi:hypothetical protein